MSPIEIGILGVIALFVLMFLGMHIGIAMGIVSIVGLVFITNLDGTLLRLGQTGFSTTASYTLAVLPLFMLMGEFAFLSGLTQEAYATTYRWLGHLPGGLAMATILGCAGFAAVCGSSIATTTTIGAVALPEMRKYKYSPTLSIGSIAAGGTLGILIPPSGGFLIYGIITEQSIGKLFLAGIIPGILLSVLFIITVYILAKVNPLIGPKGPKSTWGERIGALKDIWGVAILFLVVMGGIYSGVFTPTEAAAVGALCAFLVGLVKRRLTLKNIKDSLINMTVTTGMVFVILIGAFLFGYFMAASRLTAVLAAFVAGLPFSPVLILVCILILFLILGCVMDPYAMLLIVVPILFPVIMNLGLDPIWFAVLVVLMMELGMITPPVGMNVFIMRGVAKDVPMYTIFKGLTPFVVAMVICVVLVIVFPDIALFLPNSMK
ncbi:TRAP transporter large permease [Thermodesulfobacteriota bacterium]